MHLLLLGKTISNFYTTNEILLNKNVFIVLNVEIDGNQVFLARSFNSPKHGYTLHDTSLTFNLEEWKKLV